MKFRMVDRIVSWEPRRSIRRKLNIRNSPVNLSTFLKFNLGSAPYAN